MYNAISEMQLWIHMPNHFLLEKNLYYNMGCIDFRKRDLK